MVTSTPATTAPPTTAPPTTAPPTTTVRPTTAPLRTVPPTVIRAPVDPLVGLVWASGQDGWGTARPARVFNGGDPTGLVTGIVWSSSYGTATATGRGLAEYLAPGQIVADGTIQNAVVVASDLGTCLGRRVYLKFGVYFPEHGETAPQWFDDDVCKQATAWAAQH